MSTQAQESQQRTTQPGADDPTALPRHRAVMRYVMAYTILTSLGAVATLALAVYLGQWRVALTGSTLAILAAIGGGVLCLNLVIADRQEFYRRGVLDGWMRGWRGQPPDIDDPLTRC